jgi:hypothetical protein
MTDRRHKQVCENEDVTTIWNQRLHTERGLMANRPDKLKVMNKKIIKTCIQIDVAIRANTNVTQKEAEEKIKCVFM